MKEAPKSKKEETIDLVVEKLYEIVNRESLTEIDLNCIVTLQNLYSALMAY